MTLILGVLLGCLVGNNVLDLKQKLEDNDPIGVAVINLILLAFAWILLIIMFV